MFTKIQEVSNQCKHAFKTSATLGGGTHAKSREPGNLVPGHFWSKIRIFFRNQRLKEINLKSIGVLVENRFK